MTLNLYIHVVAATECSNDDMDWKGNRSLISPPFPVASHSWMPYCCRDVLEWITDSTKRHEKNNCKVARETRLAEEEDYRAQAQQSQGMNQPSSKKQPPLAVHPHVGESPQQHLQQWTDPTQIAWSEAMSLNETVRIGEQAFMTPDLAFGLEQLQMQQSTYFADANLQENVVPLEFMMDGIFFENGFGQQDLWGLGPEIQSCF